MGTSIELRVGGVSLSYSKNHMGMDFGFLFQDGDEARRKSEGIDYKYYDAHPDKITDLEESEAALVRPLVRVLPRLSLLGSNIETARAEYEAVIADARELSFYSEHPDAQDFLTFEEYCLLACRYPLSSLEGQAEFEDKDKAAGKLGLDKDFQRLPWTDNSESYWSELSFIGAKLAFLSAESMLQVFGLSPDNLDAEVTWDFGPLVNNGWASREDFMPGARRTQKVLVATEGASDARIINRGLSILRPDVADFFNFVNVDERHHFWGTGNLVKFAEGLLRIDIQNMVLFVLDNDAEGIDAHRKLEGLSLPANMRSMVLPSLDEFRRFRTRGPEGEYVADINGRAAAIECYLDLELANFPPALVTWSNYKRDIDAWHGALDFKESYQRHFHAQDDDVIRNGSYQTAKLQKLLDAIIAEATLVSPAA